MTVGGYAAVPADDAAQELRLQVMCVESEMVLVGMVPWAVEVCGCGWVECCNVVWCMPCMLGRLHGAVIDQQADTIMGRVCCPLASFEISSILTAAATALLLPPTCLLPHVLLSPICVYTAWLRGQTRSTHHISGSPCEDCMLSFCCTPCVISQIHSQALYYGIDPGTCCCKMPQEDVQPGYAS